MNSQVYMLIAASAVMFSVIGGLSLLAHYYTLNGIKSKTVGDGQHGVARFAIKRKSKALIIIYHSRLKNGDKVLTCQLMKKAIRCKD